MQDCLKKCRFTIANDQRKRNNAFRILTVTRKHAPVVQNKGNRDARRIIDAIARERISLGRSTLLPVNHVFVLLFYMQ